MTAVDTFDSTATLQLRCSSSEIVNQYLISAGAIEGAVLDLQFELFVEAVSSDFGNALDQLGIADGHVQFRWPGRQA